MSTPFFQVWNKHYPSCGEPPAITNEAGDKYYGYFQNGFGEQWVFTYEKKIGELLGWATVVTVKDGQVDVMLGKAEAAWLQACWKAATFAG